ncbi:hypothetical protein [Legionella cincinnatiensis]|uniref:Uncharacterized protein n=1 Tax=Legionella cincinnatiensis TaxID=28085 RepID=A0A378IIA5_9GAMM|nr:hypothetical protein [Legionella cincinnatiensis]KTC93895.1 hypothetical protein Lcin_0080 [Legionella cincinnatiensis]STX34899.1 Uncharacterised protein [Legionella cincinnatiensis]
MKKIFQWLAVVLDDIVGVGEEKPNKRYMSVYEAQKKFDAGLISMHEYNEVLKRTRM